MSDELEKNLNYRFQNKDLLHNALTHKSYLEGARLEGVTRLDNERLEFLGDSVFGLVITEYIYKKFRHLDEGDLAKLKAHLVSSDFLFSLARKVNLGAFILLGRGQEKDRGRQNKRILSSAFEALVGAVYLDANLKTVAAVLSPLFKEYLAGLASRPVRINDYKSALQEVVQKHHPDLPVYRVLESNGLPPETVFLVAVSIGEREIGRGRGRSIRQAEQDAAGNALTRISDVLQIEKLSEIFFIENRHGNGDSQI